jgi:hypothetical protein
MYIRDETKKTKWNSNVLIWVLIILLFIMTFVFNKFQINNRINIHLIISVYWLLATVYSLFNSMRLFEKWKYDDEEEYPSISDYNTVSDHYRTFSFSSFNNGLVSLFSSYIIIILYSNYSDKYSSIIIFTSILWLLLYLYLHISFSFIFNFKNNYKRDMIHYFRVSIVTIILTAVVILTYCNLLKSNEMFEKIKTLNKFLTWNDFNNIDILVIHSIIITLGTGKMIEYIYKGADLILSKIDYNKNLR